MRLDKKTVNQISLTSVRQGLSIIASMLIIVMLSHILGAEEQGIYSFLLTILVLVYIGCGLGINTSVIYFISKSSTDYIQILKVCFVITTIASFVAIAVSAMICYGFYDHILSDHPKVVLFILMCIPFYFLEKVLNASFLGLQNFKAYNIFTLLLQVTLLLLLGFIWAIDKFTLTNVALLYLLNYIFIVLLIIIYAFRKYHVKRSKDNIVSAKEIILYGTKNAFNNVIGILNYKADILIIGLLLNEYSLGLYTVAVMIVEKIWVATGSINLIFFPKVISITDERDRKIYTEKNTRLSVFVTVVISILLLIGAFPIIMILFGKEYHESIYLLRILLPGIVLLAGAKIISNYFAAINKQEINLKISLFVLIINIFLNVLLIPQIGIAGAAISTLISYSFHFMLNVAAFRKFTESKLISLLIIRRAEILQIISYIKSFLFKKQYKFEENNKY